jgi:hypothetical protein
MVHNGSKRHIDTLDQGCGSPPCLSFRARKWLLVERKMVIDDTDEYVYKMNFMVTVGI